MRAKLFIFTLAAALSGCGTMSDRDWGRVIEQASRGAAAGAASRMAYGKPDETITISRPGQMPQTFGIWRR